MLTKNLFSTLTLAAIAIYVSGCLGAFAFLGLKSLETQQTQNYMTPGLQPELPATLVGDYRHSVEDGHMQIKSDRTELGSAHHAI